MSFNQIVLWAIAFGALIGGLDKILGNRFGLGKEFDKGIETMGALALGMAGITCLTPLLQKGISVAVAPLCGALHMDPAIFGALLANDMGGYQLAMQLAEDPRAGQLAGALVASTLGASLVFNIPVGLGIVEKEKHPYFIQGLLIGFIAIPVGGICGGLAAGFPVMLVLKNIAPVAIISLLLALGMWRIPEKMTRGCMAFGKLVGILGAAGLACAIFESITGIAILPGMSPVSGAMEVVGEIAIVLAGTFPLLVIVMKVLNRPLTWLGSKLGLDFTSTSGLIFSLANSVPVLAMTKDMDPRGVVINTAWMTTASAVFGDHLGFTASVEPDMIFALVVTKFTGGILAVLIAMYMTRSDRPAAASK